jgi:hypothetical protein
MKKIIQIVVLTLFSLVPLSASVTVIENSASRLKFKWEIGSFDTITVVDSGRSFSTISFSGENMMLGDYGEAAIPGYSVYAGMPLTGSVRVDFSPGSVQAIHLDHPLKHHPAKTPQNPGGSRTDIRQGASWVAGPHYTWFRNLRASNIVICPIRYDESSRTVQLLQSGECTIEFPPASQTSRPGAVLSDYQRMLKRIVLNYDVAQSWTEAVSRPLQKAADPYPFDYNQQVYTFKIGDGHGGFNEMTVKENGILKIPGSQIKRLFSRDSSLIGTGRVALYGSWKGPLPMEAPGTGEIPAGVREIPLFRYDKNLDGKVDDNDYFLAFVTGLSDWRYDSLAADYVYSVDPYDDNRTYWLALKSAGTGASMGKFSQPQGAADTTDNFVNRIIFKQSELKFVRVE